MDIVAICAESFASATRSVVGVKPLTSPPLFDGDITSEMVGHPDILYIHLHGTRGEDYLFGDLGVTVTAEQLRSWNLRGTTVIALSCYLGEDNNPVLEALLDAGAKYVIGAPGENYSGKVSVMGADVLARDLINWLKMRVDIRTAMKLARVRVRTEIEVRQIQLSMSSDSEYEAVNSAIDALADTLGFAIFVRENGRTVTVSV